MEASGRRWGPVAAALALAAGALAAEPRAANRLEELDRLIGLKPVATEGSEAPPPPSRIGIVDLGLAYILHPAMEDYVVEERNFARPVPREASALERKAILSLRFDDQKKDYQRFQGQKSRAWQLEKDWNQRRSDAWQNLNLRQRKLLDEFHQSRTKPGANPDALARKHAAAMQTAEEAYWKVMAKIEGERKAFEQELTGLAERITSASMLTRKELSVRLQRIFADITAALGRARDRYGLAILVNKAFLGQRGVPSLEAVNRFDRFPNDISRFANPFREFLHLEPGQEDKALARDPMLEKLYGDAARSGGSILLRRWYGKINDVTAFYQVSNLNQLVLAGGVDVTPVVVADLLTRHGVPEKKARKVVEFVAAVGKETFGPRSGPSFEHIDKQLER